MTRANQELDLTHGLLITRMVWVIAFSSPDNSVIGPKSLCEKPLRNL